MKKCLAILLALTMVFALCACGGSRSGGAPILPGNTGATSGGAGTGTPAGNTGSGTSSGGSTPVVSTGNSGALSRAQTYLSVDAFSYSGLIEQLEFEGFSESEAKYAADNKADIVVCLHYNANGSGGAMVFASIAPAVKTASYNLGRSILNQIVRLGFADRGVLLKENDTGDGTNYYGILRYCAWYNLPAVLVEHCFMDNADDWAKLDTDQMGIADAIGIAEYLGLQKE